MTQNGHHPLEDALALAALCLGPAQEMETAWAFADDPLRLNLPPLVSAGDGSMPSPAALRMLAGLYLQAELEQTGLIAVAETLAQERVNLSVGSDRGAQRLEDFAQRSHIWYDRESRERLFARVFGLGPAASNDAGTITNHDFQQRFASLCLTVVRYGDAYRFGRPPTAGSEADARQVATYLLMNLGARQFGNTITAARLIQEELQYAINLLSDPGIESIFQGRGLWDTLRKILGPDAPDIDRYVRRGQSGLQILNWLASALPQLNGTPPYGALLPPDAPVFVWAADWLQASGMEKGGTMASGMETGSTVAPGVDSAEPCPR